MEHGDLSNRVSPRVLLVFENALGICMDKSKSDKYLSKKNYTRAFGYWEFHMKMLDQILWLFHKRDVRTEVVTFIQGDFVDEIRVALDEMDIPVHRVWCTTPENLGRQIAYMPDLACVYDPEPSRWLMYGSKGRFIERATQLGEDVGYGR